MVSRGKSLQVAASLVAAIFIASAVACAASSPGVEWEKTYDVQGNDRGWSMQQTADGGYIMAGTSNNLVCLVKVDPNGSTQWKNTYGFGDSAKGYSVRQATDGGYIVTGSVRQGGKDKVLLMKAGQDGKQLWNKTYGDSSAGAIEGAGTSVRQASDGGYVIAAQYPYPTTNKCGIYLLRNDADGNLIRSVMIGKNGDVTSPSVEQTADGGYIMAATIHTKGYEGSQPDYDIYLIKFNPSGDTQWERTIGGTGSQYCGHDGSVKQAADGGYVIAGENGGAYLAKADAAGNVQWSKQFNDSARASSVALADDGGYVLACTDNAGRPIIIQTSLAGDEEWRETAGMTGEAATVQTTSDGSYALSGTSGGDLYLVKLKPPEEEAPATSTVKRNSLFSGFGNLFGDKEFDSPDTDYGQVIPDDESLFRFPSFKLFDTVDDFEADTHAETTDDLLSMPSFKIKKVNHGIDMDDFPDTDDFPEVEIPFDEDGWPFD